MPRMILCACAITFGALLLVLVDCIVSLFFTLRPPGKEAGILLLIAVFGAVMLGVGVWRDLRGSR